MSGANLKKQSSSALPAELESFWMGEGTLPVDAGGYWPPCLDCSIFYSFEGINTPDVLLVNKKTCGSETYALYSRIGGGWQECVPNSANRTLSLRQLITGQQWLRAFTILLVTFRFDRQLLL